MPRRPPRTQRASRSQEPPPSQRSDDESDDDPGAREEGTFERDARNIVRLALFAEARRTTLRRDEIVKRALSSGSRTFNASYGRAQQILKETFGMELVEVMSKAERDAQERGEETAKKKAPTTSKAYVLRSILDPALIETANTFDEDIRLEENNHPRIQHRDSDDFELDNGGCILAWQFSDRLGNVGLLAVLLALILVNGKELTDVEMRGYLKSLRLPPKARVPFKTQLVESSKAPTAIETFLSNMVRQGYLDKIKTNTPAPSSNQAPKNKRPRGSLGNDQENKDNYNWRWGARSIEEFGEESIVDFITAFMVEKHELIEEVVDDEDGTPGNGARYLARKAEEAATVKRSILKAAMTDR